MTYRDDQEAALARADALARELRRVEEENAELRVERERLAAEAARERAPPVEREQVAIEAARARESRAELERLATRALRATTAEKPRRRDPAMEAERERQVKLRQAFTGRLVTVGFGLLLVIAAAAGYLVGAHVVMATIGVPFAPLLIPFVAAGAGGVYLLWGFVTDGAVQRTRRWLAGLPVSLDADDYFDYMATNFSGRLELELDITGARGDEQLLGDAVRGGMPGSTARWADGTLVVTSPKLKVFFSGKGGGSTHNAQVHRWFRRFADRVLRPIAARHRVTLRIRKR